MNVSELADDIAEKNGLDKKQARSVVDAVFKAVVAAATSGSEVSIPGFGKFKVASREARQGRNPATGATIQIAASKKLSFAPAKQVRDAMNPAAPAKGKAAAKTTAQTTAKPAAKAAAKPRAKK